MYLTELQSDTILQVGFVMDLVMPFTTTASPPADPESVSPLLEYDRPQHCCQQLVREASLTFPSREGKLASRRPRMFKERFLAK